MSAWIDISYLRQLTSRLERYKEKKFSPYLSNCRCPICHDSQKKSKKARGYFYQRENKIFYRCFNCDASMSFGKFLKDFDHNLYDRYLLEVFKEKTGGERTEVKEYRTPPATKAYLPNPTSTLKSIEKLEGLHPAKQYIIRRKIPSEFWCDIFYTPNFFKWASGHTDKFSFNTTTKDHARIIFPWVDKSGVMFGYHARTMGKEEPKYYSIMIDENVKEKVFGLDRVNESERIFVVEGPVDSLYLPNAVAVGTSALYRFSRSNIQDVVYIPDRDIRNPEVMKIVKKIIELGKKVCLLPPNLPGKDIGEFVENNLSQQQIVDIINENTFQGLEALLHFSTWKKIEG